MAAAFGIDEVGLDTLGVCAAIGVGIGAGGGAIVGAALPAKWNEVYRAPGSSGSVRVSVAPMISPRAKGVVLSLSF